MAESEPVLVDLTAELSGAAPQRPKAARRCSSVSAAVSDPDVEVVVLDDDENEGGQTNGRRLLRMADVALHVPADAAAQDREVLSLDDSQTDHIDGALAADPDLQVLSPPASKRARKSDEPDEQRQGGRPDGSGCSGDAAADPDVLVLTSAEAQRIQPSLKAQNRQLQRELERIKRLHEQLAAPIPAYWQTKQDSPGVGPSGYQGVPIDLNSAEAEKVLSVWVSGGIARDRVRSVERIENHALWRKYWQRKTEVARERHGTPARDSTELCAVADERYLFHGAASSVIRTIVETGFDVRVSNLSGALGAGVYFAEKSRYSDDYSARSAHDHETQNRARGAYGYGAHIPRPPPPPTSHAARSRGKGKGKSRASRTDWHAYQQQLGQWLRDNPGMAAVYPQVVQQAGACYTPDNGRYMLLCRVVVGDTGKGVANQRRPDVGTHSAKGQAPGSVPGYMICVFDNAQAYPEYRIRYEGVAPNQYY